MNILHRDYIGIIFPIPGLSLNPENLNPHIGVIIGNMGIYYVGFRV